MSRSFNCPPSTPPSLPHLPRSPPVCLCSMTAVWVTQAACISVRQRETHTVLGHHCRAHRGNSVFILTYCTVPGGEGGWRIGGRWRGRAGWDCKGNVRTEKRGLILLSCQSWAAAQLDMSGFRGWTLMGRGRVVGWLKWRWMGCMCVYIHMSTLACVCVRVLFCKEMMDEGLTPPQGFDWWS